MVARIAFDGVGMYGRQFSNTSPEFGTSGSFDKCWLREEDGPHLIKRGSDGYANAGFEPYAEELGFVPAARMFERGFDIDDVLAFTATHGGEELFREMVVMDAVCVNVDRHAGNYGFLVDNDTGEVRGMAPLFDQNMALLPYLMEHDDVDEYLLNQGPRIGGDFVVVARALLTSDIRSKLVALKDFEYEDPGFGYPAWKLEVANRIKTQMIDAILA